MKTAKYWKRLDNGLIECTLCPRRCRMAEGKRGACFGRRRIEDELIAETYGLACGMAVDPIEKKPLYHFLPGSSVLSFGTVGCNLTCGFCQNYHLSRAQQPGGSPASPQEIARTALQYQCESVAFTYNEPTVFFEYAVETADVCREHGLKTVAVTNGWIEPEPRRELYSRIDAANVDLKAFTDTFYQQLCGATLQPVLDTLLYIKKETAVHLEVTTLLIPGRNDSPAEIDAMTRWAVANLGPEVPWHFSAYRPTREWNEAPPTPLKTLLQAESIAKANGLQFVHLGNVGPAH
jgi:pyruvate formate lyase activating enzyme